MRAPHNNSPSSGVPPVRLWSHTQLSLSSLWPVENLSRFREHTHESRQPLRVVGYIRSGLSARYPMAGLSIRTWIETTRVGARAAFGLRKQAGLSISI